MLIGEVAQRSGISARMLRHYDRIGLVSPSDRTAGGYREYSENDLRRLFHVEGLRSLGMGLAQIADVIDDRDFDPAVVVSHVINRTREQIDQAQELVQRLEEVQATDPKTWHDVLRTIGLVRGLESASPSRRQQLALEVTEADRRDIPILVEAMLRESTEDAAGALQWAIARRGGDDAVSALAHAMQSDESDRRRHALDALVKINTRAAQRVIMKSANHEDPRIRARAIITRAQHGKSGAIPALVALISTGRDDVEAADALTELAIRDGHIDQVITALSAELAASEPVARRRLVAALTDLPIAATKDTLHMLLDDDDRATAVTARFILDTRTEDDSAQPASG
ncbi:MAG: MerR family DNA-binding transcriptional regulator [Microbacterium sp.]|uniref:MerR family DNA-binding transcriptional regulator n=1 Tax=Microbacterium sp. TaxID=51671 RepID=UPI001AC55BEA|nr:MerR family DNA-binding transcriptional regulator [Microbacterium sp.]MBN9176859.1 MerR family DNA-binding transcriptional regulator [Microbacterium sp.]